MLRALAAGLVVAVLAGLVGARTVGLDRLPGVGSLPSLSMPSDILIYDRTGTVLLADLSASPAVRHYEVPLQRMGRWLPAATVALEDPNFWIAPVPTLAQRLVRLRLPADYSGAAGKLRQTAQAARVVAAFSRNQVLAMYLDSLFYGNQAYGPEAAARRYFGVGTSQLDLAQAALLAGIPQHPASFDPVHNWPAAKQRQREVLDAMARGGAISRQQADQAAAESLRLSPAPPANLAPAFVAYALKQLQGRLKSHALDRGGSVVTTLDAGLQRQAEQAVAAALAGAGSQNAHAGALVTTDPRTGQVLAMVSTGGNPSGESTVAGPLLNPGTSFRLFTYVAAIASGRYTMASPIPDGGSIDIKAPGVPVGLSYRVPNADYRAHGTCQLPACLANSLNVPTLEVELGTGLPEIVKTADAMGAPPQWTSDTGLSQNLSPESAGPSLTLGGYGETPVQMAAGLSTIASGGVFHEIEAVREVRSPTGALLFQSDGRRGTKQAIDPGVAFVVSQMLADDDSRALMVGRGSPLVLPGRHAAALGGTTETMTDSWTLGYTPSLATVVWVGNDDFARAGAGLDAISVAAPAWHDFMAAALDSMHKGDEWYEVPAGLTASVAGGRQLYFLPGTSASTPVPALPAWAHLTDVPPRPSPVPPVYPPGG